MGTGLVLSGRVTRVVGRVVWRLVVTTVLCGTGVVVAGCGVVDSVVLDWVVVVVVLGCGMGLLAMF